MLEARISSNHPLYSMQCKLTRGIWQDWGPIVLIAKSSHNAVVMLLLEKGANLDPEGWLCPINVQDEDEDGDKHKGKSSLLVPCSRAEVYLAILVTHAIRAQR